MTTHRRIKTLTGTLVLFAAILPPFAEAANNAKSFMNGGTYCFQIGETMPGSEDTRVKLVASKAKGNLPHRIAHVDGLWTSTMTVNPPDSYISEMTGSATIAQPNDDMQGAPMLQIGMSSSDFGNNMSPATGIWIGNMVFTLNLANLTGTVVGRKSFTPIVADGAKPVTTYDTSISRDVKPISCQGI